jgi:ADP-ribosyl-[dinitrogen reductase] hydrolase
MNLDGSAYRLAVVGSGRVRGQIAMVGCPGRMASIAVPTTSAWRLQRDVATLKHWGAQALVTLLEKSELTLMRLARLPALLEAHKIAWYHLPLPDGCIPDERFEALWQGVAPRLRSALWCGGRIAVHCVDGRSRTAMVTAKLLVELGCPTQDALNRVRGARPRALASAEEEQYIRRQTPAVEAAYRTQISLAQPRGLHRVVPGEEDLSLGWGPTPLDTPDQLELLRTL